MIASSQQLLRIPAGCVLTFLLVVVGREHCRAGDPFAVSPPQKFASYTELADHQLALRKASVSGPGASRMHREIDKRLIRAAELDRVIARRLDQVDGATDRIINQRSLETLPLDRLASAFRDDVNLDTRILSLESDGDQVQASDAIRALQRHLIGLKTGDHDLVLSTLEDGPWQDRYRSSSMSRLTEMMREQSLSRWVELKALFEFPVTKAFSAIYYRIDAQDVSDLPGAGRLDFVFVKQNEDNRWVLTEDGYSTALGRAMRATLPTARLKTREEVRELINAHPTPSRIFQNQIKPRLLSTN